jgi:hypothetical protein
MIIEAIVTFPAAFALFGLAFIAAGSSRILRK